MAWAQALPKYVNCSTDGGALIAIIASREAYNDKVNRVFIILNSHALFAGYKVIMATSCHDFNNESGNLNRYGGLHAQTWGGAGGLKDERFSARPFRSEEPMS